MTLRWGFLSGEGDKGGSGWAESGGVKNDERSDVIMKRIRTAAERWASILIWVIGSSLFADVDVRYLC